MGNNLSCGQFSCPAIVHADDTAHAGWRNLGPYVSGNPWRCSAHLPPEYTVGATTASTKDPINPSHYKGDLVMRIIELFKLDFPLGNAIKYILRHGEKAGLEDLKKSRWYLNRKIAELEGRLTEGALK